MLLFSLVVWSRDSWWLFTTHSARSHCIIDYLTSIVCGRGLTPPPQTQTSCVREPTGRGKSLLVTLRDQRLKPMTASPRAWSEGCCRASQRDWGRNYQGSLEEGVKEKLEPFWHIAAFCTITLPSVVRLSLASEQNTCSSGQELSLVYHSPLKPRHMCRVLSALQMFVVNWHLQFLTSRCDKDNC